MRPIFQTSRKMTVFFLMVTGLLQSCRQVEKIVDVQDVSSKLIPLLLKPADITFDVAWQNDFIFQKSQVDIGLYKQEVATRIFDGELKNDTLIYFEHTLECYFGNSKLSQLTASNTSVAELELQEYGEESFSSCAMSVNNTLSCRVESWHPGNLISIFIFRFLSDNIDFESANGLINIALKKIHGNISSQNLDICISYDVS